MKLKMVVTKDAVPPAGSMQADTTVLRSSATDDLYFENGLVYAVSPRGCTVIPVGNVRHLIPVDPPTKAKAK